MAVLINEFEVAPPPEAPAHSSAAPTDKGVGGAAAASPETMHKIEATLRIGHERSRRLAAY